MSHLELAPNRKVMIVPLCEKCGSKTIPVDSIAYEKYRECWNSYCTSECPGTNKFKQSPYEDVAFPLIFLIPFDPMKC